MSRSNPLAGRKLISMEDLEEYPCLAIVPGLSVKN